jgi:hypothetical protein
MIKSSWQSADIYQLVNISRLPITLGDWSDEVAEVELANATWKTLGKRRLWLSCHPKTFANHRAFNAVTRPFQR